MKRIKAKTVLITGGAGFIGSYLCEFLLAKGFKVICMDNLITGSLSNISRLLKSPRFEFIKHNVSTHIDIKGKIWCVLHFASPASPIDYLKFPIQTLKVGSLGTHNALGVAKAKRAKFLLASTSEVYGDPLVHPQPESYWGNVNPIGPRGVYDEAKRFAEAITMAYHRVHKIDAKIVRIFNTYGPRMRRQDGRAIPNFISQALDNKPITVYGDGSQTRSFCYVTDLVDGIYKLMNSGINEPVNLGNPHEMTLLRLAREIIKLSGSKGKIVYRPLPQDDPKTRQPDITKARKALGWKPKVALKEGLIETIKYFKDKRPQRVAAIVVFALILFLSGKVFAYSSSDIPVRHWSYDSVEKLAMAGLMGISGLDTKPMTRVQMAYKIKEAMDNIEEGDLPSHLCFDRYQIEYLQGILYKLINEFRQELILIGATAAQIKIEENPSSIDKIFNYNPGFPIETEHRLASVKARKDDLLENENGLRLERGYNLRVRASPKANLFNLFTFSARPAFRLTETGYELFFDEAAAKFSVFNAEILAGKSAMWWGPGYHGSMLMSNNAKPLNMVRARNVNPIQFTGVFKNLGFFGFNFFVSKLEKDRAIAKPTFAGLRLEWAPLPYLSLGATRTAIMGGNGRPKPRLKDYIKIFFARSKDEFTSSASEAKASDSDQLASLDLRFIMPLKPEVRVASGLEIYGEWSGEDRFSFWENESPGFLMGLFLTDLLRNKGTDFRVEYAKNKSGWYNHGFYNAGGTGTAYTYKGEIMGHHMGGDADDLFFRVSKDVPFLATPYFTSVKVGGQLDFERHGLSQAVKEKLIEFMGDITWFHSDTLAFSLRYELEDYRNFNYVSGAKSRNHIISVELDLDF